MSQMTPEHKYTEQELIDKNMNSPELLKEWKIPPAQTGARVTLVLFIIAMVATYAGTVWYTIMGNPEQVSNGLTGFAMVIALSIATAALRFIQAHLLTKDVDELKEVCDKNFTGNAVEDMPVQDKILTEFEFRSRKLNLAGYMIVIAMIAISMLNLRQAGMEDLDRSMIYTGTVAIFALGYLWHMFSFNARVLYTQLRSRVEASARYRVSNPEAYQASQDRLLGVNQPTTDEKDINKEG